MKKYETITFTNLSDLNSLLSKMACRGNQLVSTYEFIQPDLLILLITHFH